jgi:tetratricopeptide (TPR) repeat protein
MSLSAQSAPQKTLPAPIPETQPIRYPLTQLTPEQREEFQTAGQLFKETKYAAALEMQRKILAELQPGTAEYIEIEKFASEAAINAGNYDFALAALKPIEAANANDWQAVGMLARTYAETGKKELRDKEIARILDLHKHAATTDFANQMQFYLERISVPGGTVRVSLFLEPYGKFKTELYAWVCDSNGHQLLRIALESSDIDQTFMAKEHPDLAKQGTRRYSLDGYKQNKQADGSVSYMHLLYGFFDGRPDYNLIRARMIEIGESVLKEQNKTEPTAGK